MSKELLLQEFAEAYEQLIETASFTSCDTRQKMAEATIFCRFWKFSTRVSVLLLSRTPHPCERLSLFLSRGDGFQSHRENRSLERIGEGLKPLTMR